MGGADVCSNGFAEGGDGIVIKQHPGVFSDQRS